MGPIRALRELARHCGRPVGRAILVTGTISLVCKVVGFGKELVVAASYGATPALDAYLVAIILPNVIFNAASGTIACALLPRLIGLRLQEGPEAERQAQQRATFWTVASMVVCATTSAALGPWLLRLLSPGFTAEAAGLTQLLLWGLVPYCVMAGVAQVWAVLANGEGRFTVTAASPGIISGASVIVLLLFHSGKSPWPLVAGLTLGAAADLVATGSVLRRTRYSIRLRPCRTTAFERDLFWSIWPLSLGAIFHAGTIIVDQSMASLLGPGTVSKLNYGNRLVAMVAAIVGLTLTRVAFPEFSRFAAEGRDEELSRGLKRFGLLTLCASLPAMIALSGWSAAIVNFTFRRGQFTGEVAGEVALIQALYALQLPCYLLGILIVRAAMALQMNRLTLFIGLGTLTGNAALNALLIGPLGAPGIALGTSIVYLSTCCALAWAVRRRLRERRRDRARIAAPAWPVAA